MIHRKVLWAIKRHPKLYLTRFKLLSKNGTVEEIAGVYYNQLNSAKDIPENFYEINKKIFKDNAPKTDLEKVEIICKWFDNNIKRGPGLSLASDKALSVMVEEGGGVCSDLVQIMNNFCVINDVKIREWGATRIPFDKTYGGHSFNEFFSSEKDKWILIDVSYGIMFSDKEGNLLSVIDFYKMMKSGDEILTVKMLPNKDVNEKSITRIYYHPDTSPFLICNYSNKVYDSYLRNLSGKFPTFIIHFLVYLFGKSYFYKFPLNDYKKMFI